MRLSKNLQKWVNAGYITENQASQILLTEEKNYSNTVYMLLYTIAGLLIGLGSILLISSNWSTLPDMFKITGDFLIWGGLIFGLVKTYNKKSLLAELFFVLCFLFTAASIGLIAQIYHLSDGYESFLISWALLSCPFVLVSRLKILSLLWLGIFLFGLPQSVWDTLENLLSYSHVVNIILVSVALSLICFIARKTGKLIKQRIILPAALADLACMALYIDILFFGGVIIITDNSWIAFICLIYALLFMCGRLFMAYFTQNISSFKRNIYLLELFILIIFLTRFGNLFSGGIGLILGGIYVLLCLGILKKTSKYIKKIGAF